MKSYHDLTENTYRSMKEKPLQRMQGKRTWQKWCILRDDTAKLAVQFKVHYDWSQNRGLLALIYGPELMNQEFPLFLPYVQPEAPGTSPEYPNEEPSDDEVRDARNVLDIERRDHSVVLGFV